MKPAVLYARVSTKEQAEHGFSVPAQIELLEKYAQSHDLNIIQKFQDEETAKQAGRTHFTEMLSFLKRNKSVRAILVEKTDRLYRNFKDYVTLDEMDLEIHLVKENEILSKTSKSHQKFIHGIKVLMAKNYIDNLREEVQKGQIKKAQNGDWPTYAPPGYCNNHLTRRMEPDPIYSEHIKQIFELFATGRYSLKSLAKKIQELGFIHPQSKKLFSKSSLHRILTHPIYYGLLKWAEVQVKGNHQPLITKELFDKVQAILNAKNHGIETKREFPFIGLLTCEHCGCSITAEIKKGKYVYYHCTRYKGKCSNDYIREEQLDQKLASLIQAIQIPADIADWMLALLKKEMKDLAKNQAEQHERIQNRITLLQSNMDKAYQHVLEGTISEDFWKKQSKKWQAEIASLKVQLAEAKNPEAIFENARVTLELAKTVYSQYVKQEWPEKRKMLKTVLSNCNYNRGNLIPTYKKPFDILAEGRKSGDWRRGGDSNPRSRFKPGQLLSRQPCSATPAPLRMGPKGALFNHDCDFGSTPCRPRIWRRGP